MPSSHKQIYKKAAAISESSIIFRQNAKSREIVIEYELVYWMIILRKILCVQFYVRQYNSYNNRHVRVYIKYIMLLAYYTLRQLEWK